MGDDGVVEAAWYRQEASKKAPEKNSSAISIGVSRVPETNSSAPIDLRSKLSTRLSQHPPTVQFDFIDDLLGKRPLTLTSYEGGLMPEDWRGALRDYQRRRGLKQEQLARIIGLSRPQVANILAGRFGASRKPAAVVNRLLAHEHRTGRAMMPITADRKALYPANWKHLSLAIRERAGWRCEGSPAYPDCRAENRLPHRSPGPRSCSRSAIWTTIRKTTMRRT
jgi:DNA-binding XRE family transcriptional regulator